MRNKQPRQYDDDDGRTICDMNVPGMPWYEKDKRRDARNERRMAHSAQPGAYSQEKIPLRQRLSMSLSAMLATLLVFGIIAAAIVLFILFCTNVWLA